MLRKVILGTLVMILWNGCADEGGGLSTHRQTADDTGIGMLKYRQQTVHLLPGNRYTVEDADGNVLAEDIDDWEMTERFPFLYARVQEGIADGSLRAGGPGEGVSTGLDNEPTTNYQTGRAIEDEYRSGKMYRSGRE